MMIAMSKSSVENINQLRRPPVPCLWQSHIQSGVAGQGRRPANTTFTFQKAEEEGEDE